MECVRGYGQYCPIARASEVFAERWTPLIVRNLALGCETFSDILRGAPGLSRTLLAARLRELQRHGLLSREQGPGHSVRYRLTEAGTDLWQVCLALGAWGVRWLELAPEHLDPYPVLWAMCRSADPAALPDHRVVVRLDFPALRPPNRFWLLYEHGGAEVCVHSPGGEEDLVVVADPAAFTRWHMGWTTWAQAVRSGHIAVTGPRDLARAFPTWNPHSRFADVRPEPHVLAAAPATRPVRRPAGTAEPAPAPSR
nr:helix-turn-helix domain-containing protein [Streptomyces gossypiisoli]